LHWPTNADEAPATTRPAGHGVAAAYGPPIFMAADPSPSGQAPPGEDVAQGSLSSLAAFQPRRDCGGAAGWRSRSP